MMCSRCGKQDLKRSDIFRLANAHLVGYPCGCFQDLPQKTVNRGQPLTDYLEQDPQLLAELVDQAELEGGAKEYINYELEQKSRFGQKCKKKHGPGFTPTYRMDKGDTKLKLVVVCMICGGMV